MPGDEELGQLRGALDDAERALAAKVDSLAGKAYPTPPGRHGEPLGVLFVLERIVKDVVDLHIATVKYQGELARYAAATDQLRESRARALQEASEERAKDSASREVKADHRAHEALERDRRAEERAIESGRRDARAEGRSIEASRRDARAEGRATEAARRETRAEAREVEAARRDTRAEEREKGAEKRSIREGHLGWATLGITVSTFVTVVIYTLLTKGLADSAERQAESAKQQAAITQTQANAAQRQLDVLKSQSESEMRPYLALDDWSRVELLGVDSAQRPPAGTVGSVRLGVHVVNGGKSPLRFRLVEASFRGDGIPIVDAYETILLPGRVGEVTVRSDFAGVKAASVSGALGVFRFEYRSFDEGDGGARTYRYSREFRVDLVSNRLVFTKEEAN